MIATLAVMSATTASRGTELSEARFSGPAQQLWGTVLASARATLIQSMAYTINVVRMPLYPLTFFLTAHFAYNAAGRTTAGGTDVNGFLLAGMVAMVTWSASVWWAGHSLEDEREQGTIAALFLSPASRAGVVGGYAFGGLVFLLPSIAVVALLAFAVGARFDIASAAAVVLGMLSLIIASVATGFTLASLFILSRRANLMANLIQHPVNLLAGFIVPRGDLPGWLRPLSEVLPVSHALDAFRAATLASASAGEVARPALLTLLASGLCAAIGILGMRRVEHAAKRTGQLDLY